MEAVREFYLDVPIVTRIYITLCVLTTLAVHMDFLSPLQLYFNPYLIVYKFQVWRLLTTFLYFGSAGTIYFFNIIFTYRYCRLLEDGSFHGRSSDFLMMLFYGSVLMTVFALLTDILFLGQAFTHMLVYIWSRRNPNLRVSFFGFVNFTAPYLPWGLLCFSMTLGNKVMVDILGMIVGHFYYYLVDVFPNERQGYEVLKTPIWLKRLMKEYVDEHHEISEEDRPGGFDWGGAGDARDG